MVQREKIQEIVLCGRLVRHRERERARAWSVEQTVSFGRGPLYNRRSLDALTEGEEAQ